MNEYASTQAYRSQSSAVEDIGPGESETKKKRDLDPKHPIG